MEIDAKMRVLSIEEKLVSQSRINKDSGACLSSKYDNGNRSGDQTFAPCAFDVTNVSLVQIERSKSNVQLLRRGFV